MDIQEEIKQRGVLEGRKQGMQQGMQKVALSMLQKQADIAFISEVTGLPEAEIIKWQSSE